MGRGNNQRARADEVAIRTVDGNAALGVVWHAAVVLFVLGIPEQHHALDLLADGGGGVPDGCSCEGGSLAGWRVSTISLTGKESRGEKYLYPPATILALGHLELARARRFFISVIAAAVVPSGRRLSSRLAL